MINKNFALLWFGKIISQLGDKFYAIALAWWILQTTGSAVIMGAFLFATTIPSVLLGLFTGALTDRWNLKIMLVVTDLIRGLLVLGIAILSICGRLEVWQIFTIGICLSAATAFFEPPVQAILPELVKTEELQKANGLSQMVSGICQVAGPLFGALAVSLFGMTTVFFANSASFFAAALLSSFVTWKKVISGNARSTTTLLSEVKEGLKYIAEQRKIIVVLIVIGAAHFFVGSLSVALPFLANSLQGEGVNNLGYLEMLMGVGLIAGSILNGRYKKSVVNESILFKLIAGFGAGFLLISLAQWRNADQVMIYLPILLLIGAIIANASIFWQLLLQLNMPVNMKGRVFGVSSLIGNLTLPIAYAVVGILLDQFCMELILFTNGLCLLALGIVLTLLQRKAYTAH